MDIGKTVLKCSSCLLVFFFCLTAVNVTWVNDIVNNIRCAMLAAQKHKTAMRFIVLDRFLLNGFYSAELIHLLRFIRK